MKFKIVRDYYDRKEYIYEKTSVTLKPGVTVLVGCNGAGKTTLIYQLQEKCRKAEIPYFSFDNYLDGGRSAMSKLGFFGDTDALVQDFVASEGERISNNMGRQAAQMGRFVMSNKGAEKLFFFFDAIDSGLSIDNVLEIKRYLFDTVIEDSQSRGTEVYIIVSANEYEMARGEQCLDTQSLKYVKIDTYDDYRNLIIQSRQKKNKRYGHDDFELV